MKQQISLPTGLSFTKDGSLGDLCLIIDMQNVYLPEQPWACRATNEVIQSIKNLIDLQLADNYIFTRYLAAKEPVGAWADYNQAYADINSNPWMNEIVSSLMPYTNIYPVYDKSTYSSYHNPDVAQLCKLAQRVVITGVVAECCVLATAYSAIDAGNKVIYLKDAITGLSLESEHITEQLIENFAPIHTKIMTVEDYKNERAESRVNDETKL